MRVLLGWAWTYLIVAELIGVSSGITYFINQQAQVPQLRQRVRVRSSSSGSSAWSPTWCSRRWGGSCSRGSRTARRGLVLRAACGVLRGGGDAGARAGAATSAAPRRGRDAHDRERSSCPATSSRRPRCAARFDAAQAAPGDPRGARSGRRPSRPPTADGRRALDRVSASQLHRREFMCVIGPSGCGKSTLVRILAGPRRADRRARCCSTASRSTARAPIAAWCSRATRCFPGSPCSRT